MRPTSHADTRRIEQPAAAAKALPRANAVAAVARADVGPLWGIARLNSPAAPGDIMFAVVSWRTRRLPAERDLGGVAAEGCDISLHPAEHGLLIQDAVVPQVAFAFNVIPRKSQTGPSDSLW